MSKCYSILGCVKWCLILIAVSMRVSLYNETCEVNINNDIISVAGNNNCNLYYVWASEEDESEVFTNIKQQFKGTGAQREVLRLQADPFWQYEPEV